ncbi:hypothetical protein SLS62_009556 [Diatrype stigma]|uniref:AB hydrolase-1 domain-containing protein n=1 Tax=Diatrype stigma TaxID=117547 RepID=A0AAN9UDW1_9PEZI
MDFTIVICSGAWTLPELYNPLIEALAAKGHVAVCKAPPSYPHSPDDPPKINPDADYLRNHVLNPLLDGGKDIVIFMHSYGGAYGPASLEGISKKERKAKGLEGGVIASIFNTALVVPKDTTPLAALGLDPENLPEWIDHDGSELVALKKEYAKALMFHDLPDEESERLANMLPKQPLVCFATPNHWDPFDDPYFQGTFGYIFTEADRLIPLEAQRGFAQRASVEATHVLEGSSHSPHLERPGELADVVLGLVKTINDKKENQQA